VIFQDLLYLPPMEKKELRWGVVVNPNAGSGKCGKNWPIIQKLIKRAKIEFEFEKTERKGHAIELTKQLIDRGFRKLIVVGGDGTLNEVVNGIFTQGDIDAKTITLGMIPVGTGNDWCRTFQVSTKYIDAIKLIRDEKTVIQDIGLVDFHNNGIPNRYFANVAGIGFDANVAHAANKLKEQGKGNAMSYMLILLKTLLKYNSKQMNLTIGGQEFKERMFSIGIGIGQYNGGGMKQLPNAIANDGLLDITVIKNISKWTVIKELKGLYDGTFITHPKIVALQDIAVSFKLNQLEIETDGESVGQGPQNFSILPKALRVVGSLK
jgi:YegS/Rv2252/BmrU family lipid kinase